MIDAKTMEERMKQAKPNLPADPAFTAQVMDKIEAVAPAPRPVVWTIWRPWVLAAAVAVVVAGVAVPLILTHRTKPSTVAGNTANSQPNAGNTPGTNQPSSNGSGSTSGKSAAYYQQLASNAQNDSSSIARQTGSFSDNDYADSLLADSALN
ncbi:MAG TPA: hypothetical protein VHC98_00285 [Candidatus Saccharimonadales bacterium]|nr:hypothetical protein [Candidatus Saccharimonadales bacterium]